MIGEVLTAEAALDAAGKGWTLICFARQGDVATVFRLLDRFSKNLRFKVVRVEPTAEAAQAIQLACHPTFILFENGTERFQAVGSEQLATELGKLVL